jgi:hypothetical protein
MCDKWYDSSNAMARAEHSNAVCMRKPPTLVLPAPELGLLPMPKTWRCYGTSWECPYDHTENNSKHCKICKVKRKEAENRELFESSTRLNAGMLNNAKEDPWGSAMFEDAVIPEGAGGWMPGQPREGEERANMDLNQINGR